jgi:putative lipoprotein
MKSSGAAIVRALAGCALAVLGGCGSGSSGGGAPAAEPQAVLTGTVTCRERIALPPNARVEVRLEDVSQADAPADEVAAETVATNGKQVPIPFELRYPTRSIDPSHRYAVRASITSADGDLMFTTAIHYAVLTNGAADKDVEIVVQRPGGASPAAADAPGADASGPAGADAMLPGGTWRLAAIQRPGAAEKAVGSDPRYTVGFANGRISGLAHCNRYQGGYEQPAPGQLKVSPMAATLMVCPGESIDSEFLRAVGGATRYELRGDRLLLSYGDDGGVLLFVRDEPAAATERPAAGVAAAAADSPPGAPAAESRTFAFDCDGGLSFGARFTAGEMRLSAPAALGGEQLVLSIARSASGARYQQGETVFWNKGNLATIEYRGQRYVDCKSNPSKAPSTVSPNAHNIR